MVCLQNTNHFGMVLGRKLLYKRVYRATLTVYIISIDYTLGCMFCYSCF